jgi:NADH-quinone oxidoreductase subunit M
MILAVLILLPLIGGLLAWGVGRQHPAAARWIALAAMLLDFALALDLWTSAGQSLLSGLGPWLRRMDLPWIPEFGIRVSLGLDGLSLLLVLLTAFLGAVAVVCSWTEIRERVGFFHFNLLWVLAGILGVFLALDLFLFYFFWEMMLVPMYFLIAIWGHERRVYASLKFFLFTQVSGLLMLVAILALYFIHGQSTGIYSFAYADLLQTRFSPGTPVWLMLGFLAAFAVKLPVVPLHTWLPDAHTEAPTAGSVVLAGLLLKTGAYGILRFVIPFFPEASRAFAPVGLALGVLGIVYGALLAFAQTDLKRLVAYTSVSHMGFVFLGIYAGTPIALQGVMVQLLAHGVSTGALFVVVGALQERIHTRDLRRMGGLWSLVPRMGGVALVFALASLGLPGLGDFVAEFLVLLGTFQASVAASAVAVAGLVGAAVYALWMIQRTFYGPVQAAGPLPDLGRREMAVMAGLILAIVWLGLYPQPVLRTAGPALAGVVRAQGQGSLAASPPPGAGQ